MNLPDRLAPIPCLGGPHEGRVVLFEGLGAVVQEDWLLARDQEPLTIAEALVAPPAPVRRRRRVARYILRCEPTGSWAYVHEQTVVEEPPG